MPRTTIQVNCGEVSRANAIAASILSSNKYIQVNENGENVWKCGKGFLTAMKYIKLEFSGEHTLLISGWIRSVGGGEQDLSGVVGAIPKKQILNVMQKIQMAV